ncbi:Cell wall-binding protein, partial [Acididesulfobacillus acetoxydans]
VAWLPTTAALTANTWQQVALVGVPRGGTENWTIYLNGIQVNQVSGNPVASVPGDNMLIGFTSNATSTAPHFPGLLDDVRIYTTALTPAQVQQLAGTVVTGIGPAGGSVNGDTAVTITGYNFTGATGVSFGGTPAASFTVNSDTSITAVSPAGSGAVDVTVTTQNGTSVTGPGDRFTYVPVPVVTGITPASGKVSGGTTVTITGYNFTGATGVSFGGTSATSFTVNSDTSITATAPAHATGTAEVTVTNAYGTSTGGLGTIFTYSTNELAGWWKLGEGSGTTAVDWSGYGHHGTVTSPLDVGSPPWWVDNDYPNSIDRVGGCVDFSGGDSSFTAPIPTTNTGDVSISAWVKWDGTTWGDGSIHQPIAYNGTLDAGNGYGLALTNLGYLEVISGGAWLATATKLTPNTWQHVAAVEDGSGKWTVYLNGTQVGQVNTTPATPTGYMYIGYLTVQNTMWKFPGRIDNVRIYTTALTAAQVQQLAATFPVVTGVSPTSGSTVGGTTMTITGSGFTGATGVSFGGTAATSFTVNSDTSITAISPAHATGTVDVTVTTALGGTSAAVAADRFIYVQVPSITGVSPSVGPAAGGTVVTITGSSFTGTTGVSFGGTAAASFTVNSDASITAVSPAHADGTVDVTVTTPGGTSAAVSADRFTYSTNELVGWWKLGEGSGTTAADSSGYGYNGTLTNSVWSTDCPSSVDQIGASLDFSGGNSSFTAPIPTAATANVSISAWVKWNGKTASNYQPIVYNGNPGADGYGLFVDSNGNLEVLLGGIAWLDTTVHLTPNTWQQVGLVGVPASGTENWTVYLNANPVATVSGIPKAPASSDKMLIGYATNATSTATYFPGLIDDVRLYATALSSAQIEQLAAVYPVVTGVSPATGSVNGGSVVNITGSDFTGATGVDFGSVAAASFAVNSDTSITATAPAGSGTVDVTVTAPGGTSAAGPGDQFTYLSTAKDITAFSVAGQVGSSTIDLINHAVIFHMPYGTDVSALNPSITVSANAAVSPTSGTAEDFSNPVIYTVTAPDNSSQNWSVTCLIDTVTHTVAVSANPAVDGTVSGGGTYAEGASVTVTASVYSGYTFVNWTEGGSQVSTSAAFVFTMGTADRTLVANFAAIPTYTVTYSGNGSSGGSVPTDSNNYTTGAAITVLGNTGSLVKTGSTFAGWNTAADGIGTSYAAGATLTMGSANVTMYAQWTANPPLTHTVSVSSNPPAGGTVSGGGTYAEGASVTVMATPNSGYNFVNWTENGSAVSTIAAYTFTLGTADRTLAANFAAIPPVITTGTISGTVSDGTNPLAGATVSLTVSGSVYSATTAGDGSYAILNVPAGTGYTVTANLTGYTGANATNVNVTANTTTSGVNLTLSVIPPTIYTVSIASLTDGSITASPSTAAEGTAINLTITPDAGMQLKAGTLQYNDGTTDHLISGTSFTMPAANVTVSAQFEAIPPAPTLTVLTLSGSIPDLTVGQAVYDLNNLSLNGTDQYGAPFSLSGQTVQWNLASGNAYAGLTGSLLTPLAAGSGTVTATVYGVASNPLGFTVMAPRFSGGGGGSANTPSPTPTTVTGNVTDGTTGAKVSSVTATVTTGSNDNDTVSMSAGQLAVLKQPDGTISPLSDLSHVAITCATGTPVPIFSDGTIQMADLAKGTDNNFNITCDLGHGQKITIATMQIKIDSSGNVTLSVVLIDPYGIITDARTGKALAGVNVTLYYADTGRNKAAGKTADTVVALPGIAGFKPNNNQDPQTSDSSGAYGFMVFPTTDYYIIATKDGYAQYTSPTISVEQEIVHWDFKMSPTLSGVTRLAGRSRVDTALAIAQAEYPGKIANAVLATADNYPDALTGSVLAYKVNAPILLVGSSAADQAKVLGYLKSSLDPAGTVYIMGGTAAVGSAMESQVAASGFSHIIRIAGADRYQTSAEIADQLAVKAGTPLVLVSGENYPDALSVSSVAAQMQLPILLVQRDRISNSVRQEISAIKPGKVYIIGGEGVISAAVENQVAQLTGLAQTNIVRIGGTDRYATSLAVAQYFNLTGQNVCIATGGNFPDALAGSVYAANHNAPIILVGSSLTDQAITYLKTRKLTGAAIFGGEAVVSKDIEQQLQQLIKKGGNPK